MNLVVRLVIHAHLAIRDKVMESRVKQGEAVVLGHQVQGHHEVILVQGLDSRLDPEDLHVRIKDLLGPAKVIHDPSQEIVLSVHLKADKG